MIHQAPQIIQKEMLVDVMELATLIEDEFQQVLTPYAPGWYRRMDEEPVMPSYHPVTRELLSYHVKGGTREAPWGEMITPISDPNSATSDVFDQGGDLVLEIKGGSGRVKKVMPYEGRKQYFQAQPVIPVRGIQIVVEYITWLCDRNSEHNTFDIPFEQYAKKFIAEEHMRGAEILTIEPFEMSSETRTMIQCAEIKGRQKLTINSVSDELVPCVTHGNTLVAALQEHLEWHSKELRHMLDVFIGINTWEMINVKRHGVYGVMIQKEGDYRVLEWTRLKREGKV